MCKLGSIFISIKGSKNISVEEQGVGEVPVNGSVVVNPMETTTYTVTVTGPGGTASKSITVNVQSVITLQITYPENGATINRPDTIVRGIVSNARGNETIVIVNGVGAEIFGNEFIVNGVSSNDENKITAVALDTEKKYAAAEIITYTEVSAAYVSMVPFHNSGISPLETTLNIKGSVSIENSSLTHTGPGTFEILESSADNHRVKLTGNGIHYITVEVNDGKGQIYTGTASVTVWDQVELDAFFKAKWNKMKTFLAGKDIEGALQLFSFGSRKNYREIFNYLKDKLPDVVSGMGEIEMKEYTKNTAHYRIVKEETVQGTTYNIGYSVDFMKDPFGIWRIEGF